MGERALHPARPARTKMKEAEASSEFKESKVRKTKYKVKQILFYLDL